MSDSAPGDPLAALGERVIKLEKALEDSTRKAAIVAIIAALLGSGGVAGVLQIWTVAPLRQAEANLQNRMAINSASEEQLKQKNMEEDNAIKELQRTSMEFDVKIKAYNVRLQTGHSKEDAVDFAEGWERDFQQSLNHQALGYQVTIQ